MVQKLDQYKRDFMMEHGLYKKDGDPIHDKEYKKLSKDEKQYYINDTMVADNIMWQRVALHDLTFEDINQICILEQNKKISSMGHDVKVIKGIMIFHLIVGIIGACIILGLMFR